MKCVCVILRFLSEFLEGGEGELRHNYRGMKDYKTRDNFVTFQFSIQCEGHMWWFL